MGKYEKKCPVCGGKPRAEGRARWTSALSLELGAARLVIEDLKRELHAAQAKVADLKQAVGYNKATIENYQISNRGFNHDNECLTKKLAEVTAECDAYADARSQQGSRIDALKEDIAALEKAYLELYTNFLSVVGYCCPIIDLKAPYERATTGRVILEKALGREL